MIALMAGGYILSYLLCATCGSFFLFWLFSRLEKKREKVKRRKRIKYNQMKADTVALHHIHQETFNNVLHKYLDDGKD